MFHLLDCNTPYPIQSTTFVLMLTADEMTMIMGVISNYEVRVIVSIHGMIVAGYFHDKKVFMFLPGMLMKVAIRNGLVAVRLPMMVMTATRLIRHITIVSVPAFFVMQDRHHIFVGVCSVIQGCIISIIVWMNLVSNLVMGVYVVYEGCTGCEIDLGGRAVDTPDIGMPAKCVFHPNTLLSCFIVSHRCRQDVMNVLAVRRDVRYPIRMVMGVNCLTGDGAYFVGVRPSELRA